MKPESNAKPVQLDRKTQAFLLSTIFPYAVESAMNEQERHSSNVNFTPGNEVALPTGREIPAPTVENRSTVKPELTVVDLLSASVHEIICSGIAYFSRNGYNRHGIGTPVAFAAVKGAYDWAVYTGNIQSTPESIALNGDKVVLETQVKQLIDCDEVAEFYRF